MSSQRSLPTPLVLMLRPTYLVLELVSARVPSSQHFQTTHEAFTEAKTSATPGVSPRVPSLTALTGTRSQAFRTKGEKGQWARGATPRPLLGSELHNLSSHPSPYFPSPGMKVRDGHEAGFLRGHAAVKQCLVTIMLVMVCGRSPLRNWTGRTPEKHSTQGFLSQLCYGCDRNRSLFCCWGRKNHLFMDPKDLF